MKRAAVSVVIPTYNCGRFVTQAIDSVLAQTVRPSQIIVVDDGSKDDTHERLIAYKNDIRYVRQDNQGLSGARNRGILEVEHDLIAFLDADDVWHPRKLELQLEALAHAPELGLLGTRSFAWPAAVFPETSSRPRRVKFVEWQDLVVKNYFVASSIIVRRHVLEKAGPFDSSLKCAEDLDVWLRVAELAPVANLDLPLLGYRDVPGSLSKRVGPCRAGMLKILQKVDERNAWRGRWLLRRKAYSYVQHSCSFLYDAAGERGVALWTLLKSFAWYPFPYRKTEVQTFLERPKRLLVILLRLLRLKRMLASPSATMEAAAEDALQKQKTTMSDERVCQGAGVLTQPLP